jgi:hypothetical protein
MASTYEYANKTYSAVAKDDPKDKIEVEIGDSKQVDFYPQVKIMRWDNECNVSIRLKDDGLDTETNKTKDGKVVWSKGKKEVEFYELPASDELPEGGFEFNVILKEKPDTNVIEFTLQDKDVEYIYQPELTQEEKDEGMYRPEHVIESYAIYSKTGKINYVDGKKYRCGKVGHIYRPKIEDNDGNWVWGKLNIDINKEILSVTIPQEFLDNAVYPVKHAAGLTFGYNGTPATKVFSNYTGTSLKNCNIYVGAVGTVSSMSLYCASTSGTTNIQLALYKSSDNSKVGSSGNVSVDTNAGWKSGSVSGNSEAIDYKLWFQHESGGIDVWGDSSGGTRYWKSGESYNSWASTLTPSGGPTTTKIGIYVTYSPDTEIIIPTNVVSVVITNV